MNKPSDFKVLSFYSKCLPKHVANEANGKFECYYAHTSYKLSIMLLTFDIEIEIYFESAGQSSIDAEGRIQGMLLETNTSNISIINFATFFKLLKRLLVLRKRTRFI